MANRKRNHKLQTPDPNLANPHPTAVSAEFVPKFTPDSDAAFTNASDAIFDLIPELKGEKFK